MRRYSDEELRRLRELVARRAFECERCGRQIIFADTDQRDTQSFDAEPHPKGTHVLAPERTRRFLAVEIARLPDREQGRISSHDFYVRHSRTCAFVGTPPLKPEVKFAIEQLGAVPVAPAPRTSDDLVVGDVVLSMIPATETVTPFLGPALITELADDRVTFHNGHRQDRVAGARFHVVPTEDTVSPDERVRITEALRRIRAAGCVCRPEPVVEWVGDRARCHWCKRMEGVAPPSIARRDGRRPRDPLHIGHVFDEAPES